MTERKNRLLPSESKKRFIIPADLNLTDRQSEALDLLINRQLTSLSDIAELIISSKTKKPISMGTVEYFFYGDHSSSRLDLNLQNRSQLGIFGKIEKKFGVRPQNLTELVLILMSEYRTDLVESTVERLDDLGFSLKQKEILSLILTKHQTSYKDLVRANGVKQTTIEKHLNTGVNCIYSRMENYYGHRPRDLAQAVLMLIFNSAPESAG